MYTIYVAISVTYIKALLPVCMKYTAQGESRVGNITRSEAECYICPEMKPAIFVMRPSPRAVYFHTNEEAVL